MLWVSYWWNQNEKPRVYAGEAARVDLEITGFVPLPPPRTQVGQQTSCLTPRDDGVQRGIVGSGVCASRISIRFRNSSEPFPIPTSHTHQRARHPEWGFRLSHSLQDSVIPTPIEAESGNHMLFLPSYLYLFLIDIWERGWGHSNISAGIGNAPHVHRRQHISRYSP